MVRVNKTLSDPRTFKERSCCESTLHGMCVMSHTFRVEGLESETSFRVAITAFGVDGKIAASADRF